MRSKAIEYIDLKLPQTTENKIESPEHPHPSLTTWNERKQPKTLKYNLKQLNTNLNSLEQFEPIYRTESASNNSTQNKAN